jgi:DNA modification methylase
MNKEISEGFGGYDSFLQSKIKIAKPNSPELGDLPIHPSLSAHSQIMARWLLSRGRGLLAASFGLQKTRTQCGVAKALHEHTGKKFLLICPLGVRHQFQQEDGPVLGMDWQYCTSDLEVQQATSPYIITNYERVRDGGITPALHDLCGASLDEGSVLRSLGSKTCDVFEELFKDIPNRYVCTATPSPNNYREIIYYAHWLGVMDRGQILTRFFMRNPDKAGDLQIIPEHEESFWLWVASWALFLFRPSDIGCSDEGYNLPELRVHWHRAEIDHSRAAGVIDNRGQAQIFVKESSSISETSKENHETLTVRLAKAKEIISALPPDAHTILWHDYEFERAAIEKELPQYTTVFGSQKLEIREDRIVGFAHGTIPHLAVKASIAGSGCNLQRHCHTNIFLGPTFRFQDFIQAVHRTYRFQQEHPVDVHIIYAETQEPTVRAMKTKWKQHDKLTQKMREIIQQYGLNHEALNQELSRKVGIERQEWKGERATIVLNDTVREAPLVAENSVDLIHTSVPFGNQYEYGINVEDFGHSESNEVYHEQMDFLIPELLRILKPGRIAAIHVKDRIRYGWQTKSGVMEVEPFSDDTVAAFRKHGFMYEGRRTIVTDVVRENNSTYRLGYTEMCKDASKMGSGLPEYLLLFRKPPTEVTTSYADEPIVKEKSDYSLARWQIDASSFWGSDGKRMNDSYDYDSHVHRLEEYGAAGALSTSYCSEPARSSNPDVWTDVNFMQCLNNRQVAGKQIKHLCPLPIDIVKRTILLYSNPGELIYDPFSGLGTVPYVAVLNNRRGYGVELHPDYYYDSLTYLKEAEDQVLSMTLFSEGII